MPQGDKTKYTEKQRRKAGHIAERYEARGVPEPEAEARAWATVNKDDGGGKKPGGSGRGRTTAPPVSQKSATVSTRPVVDRSATARTGAAPRRRAAANA